MEQVLPFLLPLLFYLVGSVNFSLLVCRLLGRGDLRKLGSGNPGMANAWRVLGPLPAAVILLLDAGRGWAGGFLASRLAGGCYGYLAMCLALLAGNLFPLFHQFRGGKGFATSMGLYLSISPAGFVIAGVIWLALALALRISSLATFSAAITFTLWAILIVRERCPLVLVLVILPIIFFTHRSNIRRLWRGEENRLR
jgi:glycerol-3-phosphate acyltransferase PlsY